MDNENRNMQEVESGSAGVEETLVEEAPEEKTPEEPAIEEKRLRRKKAQGVTFKVLIVLTVIVAAYIIYALVTKDVNIFIFQILLGVFIVGYLVLSDIVEPKLGGDFEELDDYRKMGFIKMLVMDVIGTAALLYWIVGMGTDEGVDFLIPALIYLVCLNMKRRFRDEFQGVKKEDPEDAADEEDAPEDEAGREPGLIEAGADDIEEEAALDEDGDKDGDEDGDIDKDE